MPSPFPGIDPFLEDPAFASDFHLTFVNYWCEAIADVLPVNYDAILGERIGQVPDAEIATLEPVTIPLTILEGPRETYIEILHRSDRSLVTVLELLSPANKQQPGRTEYLAKRNALLYQQAHLVELDLLRGGQRPPMQKPLPPGDGYYFISRVQQRPDSQVYAWPMAHPLPTLPIPLRAPDADIVVDLGAVFTTASDRGRFLKRINYDGPVPTHLAGDEPQWATGILAAHL